MTRIQTITLLLLAYAILPQHHAAVGSLSNKQLRQMTAKQRKQARNYRQQSQARQHDNDELRAKLLDPEYLKPPSQPTLVIDSDNNNNNNDHNNDQPHPNSNPYYSTQPFPNSTPSFQNGPNTKLEIPQEAFSIIVQPGGQATLYMSLKNNQPQDIKVQIILYLLDSKQKCIASIPKRAHLEVTVPSGKSHSITHHQQLAISDIENNLSQIQGHAIQINEQTITTDTILPRPRISKKKILTIGSAICLGTGLASFIVYHIYYVGAASHAASFAASTMYPTMYPTTSPFVNDTNISQDNYWSNPFFSTYQSLY